MKKKIIILIFIILVLGILAIIIHSYYKQYQIDHAVKIVELNNTNLEVYSKVKLKELINEINGTLLENPTIDTTKVGEKDITFKYTTDKNITVDYTITVNIIDQTPPLIYQPSSYSVTKGVVTKEELETSFFCGDNYDPHPKCTLEGDFNLEEVGTYDVTLKGEDSSGNISTHSFSLRVKEKSSSKGGGGTSYPQDYTDFNDIIKNYKTENTKIGIDVSHWQGTIDFEKVKESGVEFVYIRVGRGNGIGEDYVLDDKFNEYIKGFNKVKIPVGVYFYSNANSKEDARREAKWILSKIKKYKVDLEIVFDWENWSDFQEFDLSFYSLTETAKEFVKTVEKKGYKGMVYSSKNYLENIWYPLDSNIWLAHYTNQTNYEGKYKVWQICDDGKVAGIDDNLVDIDILYQ